MHDDPRFEDGHLEGDVWDVVFGMGVRELRSCDETERPVTPFPHRANSEVHLSRVQLAKVLVFAAVRAVTPLESESLEVAREGQNPFASAEPSPSPPCVCARCEAQVIDLQSSASSSLDAMLVSSAMIRSLPCLCRTVSDSLRQPRLGAVPLSCDPSQRHLARTH